MATFISECSSADTACINAYATYTSSSTKLRARGSRAFVRLCDTDPICYTVEAEICAALDANTLRILDCGKLVISEPTANTVTDDYGCNDSTVTEDYSHSVEFYVRYHPDNEDFMEQLCSGYFAEIGWVCCDNLVWIPANKPEISVVGPIDDGGFKSYKITITWNQDCGTMRSIPARSPLAL